MAIEHKVIRLIAEKLRVDLEDIDPKMRLDTLGADSLNVVEIVMSVEELLDIDDMEPILAEEEKETWSVMTTVREIIDFAEEHC